jgi:hypothetical protein
MNRMNDEVWRTVVVGSMVLTATIASVAAFMLLKTAGDLLDSIGILSPFSNARI